MSAQLTRQIQTFRGNPYRTVVVMIRHDSAIKISVATWKIFREDYNGRKRLVLVYHMTAPAYSNAQAPAGERKYQFASNVESKRSR